MSVIHRLKFEIACPSCGAAGALRMTEDAGPPFDDVPRRTYTVEAGAFLVIARAATKVECETCGAKFPVPV